MRFTLTHHPVLKEQKHPAASFPIPAQNEQTALFSRLTAPRNGNEMLRVKTEDSHSLSENYPRGPIPRIHRTEARNTTAMSSTTSFETKRNREQMTRSNSDDELFDLAERLQQRQMQFNTHPTSVLDTHASTIPRLPPYMIQHAEQGKS